MSNHSPFTAARDDRCGTSYNCTLKHGSCQINAASKIPIFYRPHVLPATQPTASKQATTTSTTIFGFHLNNLFLRRLLRVRLGSSKWNFLELLNRNLFQAEWPSVAQPCQSTKGYNSLKALKPKIQRILKGIFLLHAPSTMAQICPIIRSDFFCNNHAVFGQMPMTMPQVTHTGLNAIKPTELTQPSVLLTQHGYINHSNHQS